jgi:hypothetical protein
MTSGPLSRLQQKNLQLEWKKMVNEALRNGCHVQDWGELFCLGPKTTSSAGSGMSKGEDDLSHFEYYEQQCQQLFHKISRILAKQVRMYLP